MTPEPPSADRDPVDAPARAHRTRLVTLVFTDLVDSVALRRQLGDQAGTSLLQTHRHVVRQTLARFTDADEIETAGDSFLLLFARPSDAVKFALLVQMQTRRLAHEREVPLAARVGIHVGEVVIEEHALGPKPKDVYGTQTDLCARVMALAAAGQILLTRAVFDSARQALKGEDLDGVRALVWLNHGSYLLKGFDESVEVCEVGEAGIGVLSAPAESEKGQRQFALEEEPVLGWRPALGQVVPRTQWLLERKLGEGGFGEVWLGCHQTLKERRVFKFCFRADRVRSLRRETTLFRVLRERVGDHPNIVRLLEVSLDEPPYYVVMDHVEGRDLKGWSDACGGAARVPLETRLEIVAQIAGALQVAHEAGVIHRDVKPANILVAATLEPSHHVVAKLTDFGIGQVLSEEALKGVTKAGFTDTMLADASSAPAGSQMYMAPELLAGKPASTRSDIYSLGVVLYQLLVGDFTRPLTTDWADHIADPLLREDLKRCFAGNPDDRFAAAGQLAASLRALPQRRVASEHRRAELAALERAAYRRGIIRTASTAAVIVALVTGLAIVALYQSRIANATALRAQGNLYAANLNLAQQAWEQNAIDRLEQLLEETRESPARGFEWAYWQRQTHLASRTLRGHLLGVKSVAFSPDGQRMVTGSDDQTAKIWDASSGQELITLAGHTGRIRSVAFSRDGRYIVTGSEDRTAMVWDAATGRRLRTLAGHSAGLWSVAFSPDGRWIVTGSADRLARVWEAGTGRAGLTLEGHNADVVAVAFSPDGRRIVTASGDWTGKLWEAGSGRELHTLVGHGADVVAAAFSADGRQIVTGSVDRTARVWDAASGRELGTLRGHGAQVWAVAFSPDGRIVTGSDDKTAKVWEGVNGSEPLTLRGHSGGVFAVGFSPDGRQVLTGSSDRTARIWDAATHQGVTTLEGHGAGILAEAFSPDGRRIVTGSEDRTAKVWDAAGGRELLTLTGHSAGIWSVAFSPDGRWIATSSPDQTARVWEAGSGRVRLTLKGHSGPIWSVAFSPDGQRIVTGSGDRTAKVWDAASGRELLTLSGHSGPIWSVAFSPGSERIATASVDRTARVWDAADGRERLTLEGHRASIRSVVFSPDGERIATGSDDQTAKVWEAASGRNELTLEGHTQLIRSVAFSPDGRRIVTGSADRTAKVWDAASGRELLSLAGHGAGIRSVAFSPDGQRLLTGGADGTAKVWHAARPDQIAAWQADERAAAQHLAVLQREDTAAQARERAVRARDEGAIKRWLILAPIPLPPGQTGRQGLATEQIAGEGRLRPEAGDTTVLASGELKWQEVIQEDDVIDFNMILGEVTVRSVAYAVCYIHSDAAQRGLQLLVGSDDQAKVYLNGRQVHEFLFRRGLYGNRDTVPGIALAAGLNVLVFKVVNETSFWRGSIQVTDAQGEPVKGIKVTLTPGGLPVRSGL